MKETTYIHLLVNYPKISFLKIKNSSPSCIASKLATLNMTCESNIAKHLVRRLD